MGKNRRDRTKYPALDVELNIRSRWEEIQDVQEYANKLNDKDKAWLNKFMDEYVGDKLDRKNLKNNLHNTKKLKKSCDDRNNARNRDVLTRAKITGFCSYIEDLSREIKVDTEEELINTLDGDKENE